MFDDPAKDPVISLRNKLETAFNAEEYPNWTFLCGTAITTLIDDKKTLFESSGVKTRNSVVKNLSEQWLASFGPLNDVIFDMLVNFIKNCHSYPSCEVRNRNVIVSNIPISPPTKDAPTNVMTTEKYYVSNEDFLLYDVDDKQVVTEQMTAYPFIDLSGGDAKETPFDQHAIFTQKDVSPIQPIETPGTNIGVEICLDHSDVRLRRNLDNEPNVKGGIHIQLIPSCGMQINLASVAANANGLVFNCDGQYALNKQKQGQGIIDEVNSLYANYNLNAKGVYAAHSQLARVKTMAIGSDPNDIHSRSAVMESLDADSITVVKVEAKAELQLDDYFAGGPGEIHIYGLETPYDLT
jgi:hypothetical protein